MNEAVPRNKAAVVNVLPATDWNKRRRTTTRIKVSAAIKTKTKEMEPKTKVTPPIEANRTILRIGWVSKILAPNPQENANVVTVRIMRPKIVKSASNVGAWDIFGVSAAVGPNL